MLKDYISLNIFPHVVLGLVLGIRVMRNVLDYLAGDSRNGCSGVCEFYRKLLISFNLKGALKAPAKRSQHFNAAYRNMLVACF